MRFRPRVFSLFLALSILATGCGGEDSQGPDLRELDGTWAGGTVSNGFSFQITMSVVQEGSAITGTGTISGSGPTCGVSISGDRDGTEVSLSIACPGFQPIGFSGEQRSGSVINGSVSGSGLPTTTFDLLRQ